MFSITRIYSCFTQVREILPVIQRVRESGLIDTIVIYSFLDWSTIQDNPSQDCKFFGVALRQDGERILSRIPGVSVQGINDDIFFTSLSAQQLVIGNPDLMNFVE